MRDFKGKTAVITGAASGIGFALARQACKEGMNVALADINEVQLARVSESLGELGTEILPVVTDVGNAESVEKLAQTCFERFGAVDLLCNNAGLQKVTDLTDSFWDIPLSDWEGTMRVNLWGVIHGCRSFIPKMNEQKTEGIVMNTASMLGLFTVNHLPVYTMTKHAVVSLSEVLSHQLAHIESRIKVAVLCPELTATSLLDTALKDGTPVDTQASEQVEEFKAMIDAAKDPAEVASYAFQALREAHFYVFPVTDLWSYVTERMDRINRAKADQTGD